ncbi:hypothetical protein GGR58DRAFT_476051 [Xylaria digitata]|nr:hypothetical protein GGR58DRAFT_476051 [Xylaria digitata]
MLELNATRKQRLFAIFSLFFKSDSLAGKQGDARFLEHGRLIPKVCHPANRCRRVEQVTQCHTPSPLDTSDAQYERTMLQHFTLCTE